MENDVVGPALRIIKWISNKPVITLCSCSSQKAIWFMNKRLWRAWGTYSQASAPHGKCFQKGLTMEAHIVNLFTQHYITPIESSGNVNVYYMGMWQIWVSCVEKAVLAVGGWGPGGEWTLGPIFGFPCFLVQFSLRNPSLDVSISGSINSCAVCQNQQNHPRPY